MRLEKMPQEVVREISEIFRTRNVIRWMQKLYTKPAPSTAARFLRELAESLNFPFYTRASALDDYIQSPQTIGDAHLLATILEIIQTRQELRDYFFRSRPHPLWAHILWQAGFFETPPQPERVDEDHVVIPRWDVQEFLLSVAPSVPGVVLTHVEHITPNKNYLPGAIRALCLISGNLAETRVDIVARWLDQDDLWAIADQTIELIKKLAKEQRYESALRLFSSLAVPVPSKNVHRVEMGSLGTYWTMNSEARSKVGDWEQRNGLSELTSLFSEAEPERFAAILEEQLRSALRLEAEAEQQPEAEFESHWRHAIEDSGQDPAPKYKDYLLASLRNTLEAWAVRDPTAVRHIIERYLSERNGILRRLAFHILSRFPREFRDKVIGELKRPENFDDLSIHHEFFQLLTLGYSTLSTVDRGEVLRVVLCGPRLEELRAGLEAQGEEPEAVDAYLKGYNQRCTRDRLWMIKDHLDTEAADVLERLVAEQGQVDHPDFLSWSSSSFSTGGFQREASLIQEEQIATKSPDELVVFLREWSPDQVAPDGAARPSFRDMAFAVASATSRHLSGYSGRLAEIALLSPEFADALVNRLLRGDEVQSEEWMSGIDLCEQLLSDETVRADLSRLSDVCWVDVRRSIARSLATQLEKATQEKEKMDRYVPLETLPRVREVLMTLLRDPDSEPTRDDLDGELTRDDPITVSMNHVRPIALAGLIDCELCRLFSAPDFANTFGPARVDPIVRNALAEELSSSPVPNCSAHAVFGRYLIELTWLDEAWTLAHLDAILPSGDSQEDRSRFGAAFNAFVWRRRERIYTVLFEALLPKYRQAIENLQKGDVPSRHHDPGEGIAVQLLCDFLHTEQDIVSNDGEESLIAEFFRKCPVDTRSRAAWLLWDVWKNCPAELAEKFWQRIRVFWEWRVAEASRLNHTTDLDGEMEWYAYLAAQAPESETLVSLWPLLEGVLPHLRGARRGHFGWDEMERYLATEIERDRARAIRMYRLMHEQQRIAQNFSYRYENERKIIETALKFPDSQCDALAVIDLIGSKGSDRHRDLYEQYAG